MWWRFPQSRSARTKVTTSRAILHQPEPSKPFFFCLEEENLLVTTDSASGDYAIFLWGRLDRFFGGCVVDISASSVFLCTDVMYDIAQASRVQRCCKKSKCPPSTRIDEQSRHRNMTLDKHDTSLLGHALLARSSLSKKRWHLNRPSPSHAQPVPRWAKVIVRVESQSVESTSASLVRSILRTQVLCIVMRFC